MGEGGVVSESATDKKTSAKIIEGGCGKKKKCTQSAEEDFTPGGVNTMGKKRIDPR